MVTAPLATTTITATRPTSGDPYETAAGSTTVAARVRAHISGPSGRERVVGGSQSTVDAELLADPIADLDSYCTVVDDATGLTYQVAWVEQRHGLGLDHTKAGLNRTTGASNG